MVAGTVQVIAVKENQMAKPTKEQRVGSVQGRMVHRSEGKVLRIFYLNSEGKEIAWTPFAGQSQEEAEEHVKNQIQHDRL